MTITPFKNGHLLLIPESRRGGNLAKLQGMPAFHKWQEGTSNLIVRINGVNLQYIINTWPEAAWIGGTENTKQEFQIQQGAAEEVVRQKNLLDILPSDDGFKYHRTPLQHQRKGFQISRDRKAFALLMEQGTGKTKIILDNAVYLYEKGEIEMLIVVAWPNGVHRNWIENEVPEDIGIPFIADFWTSNYSTKYRQNAFKRFIMAERDKLKIFTFNIEAFTGEVGKKFLLQLLKSHRCLLAIDQSASIKNPAAKRTKFLIDQCSEMAPYRRILDGDPCAEGASELYAQFKFLDPMIIGHDTWTGFRAEYCVENYFGGIGGYKNIDELQRKIDGYCYRVTSDECQELPPRIYKRFDFELDPEERRAFDQLKAIDLTKFREEVHFDEGFEDPEDNPDVLEEHMALVKNLRLQQISSGWWPKDDFRPIESGLPSRCKALLLLLKSLRGEKCLIFSRFRADLALLERELGKKAVAYHGGVGEEARAENKRQFKTNPKILYFLGQPRTAGIGHTLTEAKHIIFYCNDPSYRLRAECEKRSHRQGLKHPLKIWDLIAKKTQDVKQIQALRAKQSLSAAILKDPKGFFLDYEE